MKIGTKITAAQFVEQWCPAGSPRIKQSQFEFDVSEFVTEAGIYSKEQFQSSFEHKSFCGNGPAWKARESKWGKKFRHPIMSDSGRLEASIKGRRLAVGTGKHMYLINTTEVNRPVRGKRGRVKNGSVGYAAVHNTDERVSPYTVNQWSTRTPVQRQFIGHNDGVDHYINTKLVKKIFSRLP